MGIIRLRITVAMWLLKGIMKPGYWIGRHLNPEMNQINWYLGNIEYAVSLERNEVYPVLKANCFKKKLIIYFEKNNEINTNEKRKKADSPPIS